MKSSLAIHAEMRKARSDGVERLAQETRFSAGKSDREKRRLEHAGIDASAQQRGELFGRRDLDRLEACAVAAAVIDPAARGERVEVLERVHADDFAVQVAGRAERRIGFHEQHRIGVIAEIERFGRDELHRDVVRDRSERREQAARGDICRTADQRREARRAAAGVDQVDRQAVRGKQVLLLGPQQRFDRIGSHGEHAQCLERLRTSRRDADSGCQRRGSRDSQETATIQVSHELLHVMRIVAVPRQARDDMLGSG